MKKLILFIYSLYLAITPAVHAQTNGTAPDVGAGKKRAAVCFACHNADGISKIPGTPHLAGQDRHYLESALRAYREGQLRQNPTMNAMAKPLTDRDITNIAAYFSLQSRMSNGQTAAQTIETLERIRPVAEVAMEKSSTDNGTPASGSAVRSGESIYKSNCMACHDTGAAGAPKLGDKAAWAPRLSQGNSTLLQHALQGYKGMPAKGGCAACTDSDIKAAVEYLTQKGK